MTGNRNTVRKANSRRRKRLKSLKEAERSTPASMDTFAHRLAFELDDVFKGARRVKLDALIATREAVPYRTRMMLAQALKRVAKSAADYASRLA